MSNEYLVVWKINIAADTPEEAAQAAQRIQRDRRSLATIYHVTPFCADCRDLHTVDEVIVDLQVTGVVHEH